MIPLSVWTSQVELVSELAGGLSSGDKGGVDAEASGWLLVLHAERPRQPSAQLYCDILLEEGREGGSKSTRQARFTRRLSSLSLLLTLRFSQEVAELVS